MNQKLPIVDPPASQARALRAGPLPVPATSSRQKVIERKVFIRVVEDIKEYDFPQAAKAWQALEAAGLEPGELVANALEQGHDYKSNQLVITEAFKQKQIDDMLGETIVEGTRLVSYQYVQEENLLADPNTQNNSTSLVPTSQDLTVAQQKQDKKAVKLIAVLRQKLPNLLK